MRRPASYTLSALFGATILILPFSIPAFAALRLLEEGDVMMVADQGENQFGALKVEKIDTPRRTLVFRWFLPPEGVVSFTGPEVASGTMEIRQVRGVGIAAFGPFVLEWHGSDGAKAVFSANGLLGLNPLKTARSGIKEPTAIQDARAGYLYELASTKESDDPLGIRDTLADLPKARVGFTVVETGYDFGDGVVEPAVAVVRVDQDSDAFKQGVRRGQIILAFNGVDLHSVRDFQNQIKMYNPEETASVTVLEGESFRDIVFSTESRIAASPKSATEEEVQRDLTPEEEADLANRKEVRNLIEQSLNALKAVHFD